MWEGCFTAASAARSWSEIRATLLPYFNHSTGCCHELNQEVGRCACLPQYSITPGSFTQCIPSSSPCLQDDDETWEDHADAEDEEYMDDDEVPEGLDRDTAQLRTASANDTGAQQRLGRRRKRRTAAAGALPAMYSLLLCIRRTRHST